MTSIARGLGGVGLIARNMTEKTYNGWSNYETWAVALWLDNDEATYLNWREMAQQIRTAAPRLEQVFSGVWSEEQAACFALADQLRNEIEGGSPQLEPTLYSDLLGAALAEVNWTEIAEQLLAEPEA